jgi:2-dehydro-3-deoxy-D-arabinonate dehydratase
MYLTRHQTAKGARWAVDGHFLPEGLELRVLLELPRQSMLGLLGDLPRAEAASGALLAPIEPAQEVWAAGVTYLRSREARRAESAVADVYERVYEAERPELFFKAVGWRVAGAGAAIRIRADSSWNVPEPEMVLVVNRQGEIVGYCAGNDMSSRSIEGENPLYLPQAKVYNGSCGLGPGIKLAEPDSLRALPIRLAIERDGVKCFEGQASTADMKRTPAELVAWLRCELDFPGGVFLMTGTCVVPPGEFTLRAGDDVRVQVGELTLENTVQA